MQSVKPCNGPSLPLEIELRSHLAFNVIDCPSLSPIGSIGQADNALKAGHGYWDKKMTPSDRFHLIARRQFHFQWGDQYEPAIRATRQEAPRISRVTQLNSQKLGRTLHLISSPERACAQLALYHPALFELHEQRHLSPGPSCHPLHGHSLADGIRLPGTSGTVAIASRLGLKRHPRVVVSVKNERRQVPYPYVGDLLLFLTDNLGKPYCVNWSIKSCLEDFKERRRASLKTIQQRLADKRKEQLRQDLESEYYSEMGIRTIQVAPELFDQELLANINLLYGWHSRKLNISEEVLLEFQSWMVRYLEEGRPLSELVAKFANRWGKREAFLGKIYQDIWHRKLNVDLYRPIFIDKPQRAARVDFVEQHKSLFEEVSI